MWADKPYAWILVVTFLVLGVVAGFAILPESWSLWRKIGAGLLMGIGSGLILASNRLISND